MTFTNNIKDAFGASSEEQDRGTLVETVLLIAGFAVVAILVVTWIGNAIAGQAADVAECISGANSFAGSDAAQAICEDADRAAVVAAENDTEMDARFG